jgi:hypothetical protein
MKITTQTPLNHGSLNLDDKFEVKHWTTQWGVTVEDLRRAIDRSARRFMPSQKSLANPKSWKANIVRKLCDGLNAVSHQASRITSASEHRLIFGPSV